jgi:hypothetical protein
VSIVYDKPESKESNLTSPSDSPDHEIVDLLLILETSDVGLEGGESSLDGGHFRSVNDLKVVVRRV